MKNILKKKNIWLILAVILFVGLVGYNFVQAATSDIGSGSDQKFSGIPTENKNALDLIKPLIHRGGGQQAIGGFLDLFSINNGSIFSAVSADNKSSVFDKAQDADSFFATLGNSWVGGRLFVGVPRYDAEKDDNGIYNKQAFDFSENLNQKHNWIKSFNYGSLQAQLQKVNVQGDIIATNLIHSGGSDEVCIDSNGTLVICNAPAYHWETGNWSDCSAGGTGAGTCSGSWTVTGADSCTGMWNRFECVGTYNRETKIDWNGVYKFWRDNTSYKYDESTAYSSGESGNYPKYKVAIKSSTTNSRYVWKETNCTVCAWHFYSNDIYRNDNVSCGGVVPGSLGACENDYIHNGITEDRDPSCSWDTVGYSCSTIGATTPSTCIASPHNTCIWNSGADTTNYCSDKDGTSASECTSYNNACTWSEGGTSVKTRTVVCKDSSNQIVADSFCTGDKPVIEESCTISTNTTYSCTGTTPLNSRFCRGDDLSLTNDTPKTVVDSCGTPKCEYICNSGYIKSGNSCVQHLKIDWTGSSLDWVEGNYYGNVTSPSCGYSYMVDFSISGTYWLRRLTIDSRGLCVFRNTSVWEKTTNPIYQ